MMNVAEFEDLLDRYGEDLSVWPADRRSDAAALLSASEQARSALAEARLLRGSLQSPPMRAPAGLVDQIMRRVRQPEATTASVDAEAEPNDDGSATSPQGPALISIV